MATKHLIVLVHGIRDPGVWEEALRDHFQSKDPNTVVIPIRTETVDILRFLEPTTLLRKSFISNVEKTIESAVKSNPDHKLTIISHSFGTYIVANILKNNTNLHIDKLILCGGIVSRKFNWDPVVKINFSNKSDRILNEYSPEDVWPILAKLCAFGYGNTGSTGCGAPVFDRRHHIKHSEYLKVEFAKKYWTPFIFHNQKMKAKINTSKEYREPISFYLTKIPGNLMFVAVTVTFVFIFAAISQTLNYRENIIIDSFKYSLYEEREPRIDLQGNKSERIFSHVPHFDNVISAHSLDSVKQLVINITNRPPIRCEDSEISEDWGRNKTTYRISFERNSWLWNLFSLNWTGEAKINFIYKPKVVNGNIQLDRLLVQPMGGIERGTIIVDPTHTPEDECLGEEADMFEVVDSEHQPSSLIAQELTYPIVGSASAAIVPSDTLEIERYLNSSDEKVRDAAMEAIRRDPGSYSQLIWKILSVESRFDTDNKTALLNALTITVPQSHKVGQSAMEKVFPLTWHNNFPLRSAARRYLRSAGVADRETADMFFKFFKSVSSKIAGQRTTSGKYSKIYLCLVAVRDVYYNLGVRTFQNSKEILGSGEPVDKLIDNTVEYFDKGIELLHFVPDLPGHEKVTLAKNNYGKALTLLRYAYIKDIASGREKSLNSEEIKKILKIRKEIQARLPTTTPKAKAALLEFKEFIKVTKNFEKNYPWKRHIKQAKNCVAGKLKYDCLD